MFGNFLHPIEKFAFKSPLHPSYTPYVYFLLCKFINFCNFSFFHFSAHFAISRPTFLAPSPHIRALSAPSPIRPLRRTPSPAHLALKPPLCIPLPRHMPTPAPTPLLAHFGFPCLCPPAPICCIRFFKLSTTRPHPQRLQNLLGSNYRLSAPPPQSSTSPTPYLSLSLLFLYILYSSCPPQIAHVMAPFRTARRTSPTIALAPLIALVSYYSARPPHVCFRENFSRPTNSQPHATSSI